ncbi:MAG: HAD family hydrolase [Anaerolineae bacterium]
MKLPLECDAVIFDVDGVLIDDSASYSATIKAVVRHIVHGMHRRPAHLCQVEDRDIRAFKAAGGFNDDWVLSYAMAGILLAWPREDERPDLPAIARESAGRGLKWIQSHYFPHLTLDFELVRQLCLEYFWGEDLLTERMGLPAMYYHGPGFVRRERALVPADFLQRLTSAGVRRFGIITGRDHIELEMALKTLGWDAGTFDSIVTAEYMRKPDPRALHTTMEALRPHLALYIGDTGDDRQMMENYRRQYPTSPACLFAMVTKDNPPHGELPAEVDILLHHAEDVLPLLRGH